MKKQKNLNLENKISINSVLSQLNNINNKNEKTKEIDDAEKMKIDYYEELNPDDFE